MSIAKEGLIKVPTTSVHTLVPNFSETGQASGWTIGGSVTNNVAVLTGTAPAFKSVDFTVGANDIVCFEFTIYMPTVSTGNNGIYIGSKYGQKTYTCSYSTTTNTWSVPSSTNTNPYFITAFNNTTIQHYKTYIVGTNIDMSSVPPPSSSSGSLPYAIKLIENTTTSIREGYNSGNTSMEIHISNPLIYKINHYGVCETKGEAMIGKGFISFESFNEI